MPDSEAASLREDTCPICGDANACGLAAGHDTCWCYTASVPPGALERVPAAARDRSCICAACAGQTAATRSSPAGS